MKVHFSSKSNEWATPQPLFDKISELWGPFDLDPCATHKSHKCALYITQEQDGLTQPWGVPEKTRKVFMNPPYGREIGKWVKKAYEEAQKGCIVFCLIPSRTDTQWWHYYCMHASMIVFLKGRVKFTRQGKKSVSAPFPSCLVIFRQKEIDTMPEIGIMDA